MTWDTEPKEWKFREPVTAEKLNTEIRDRFNYLLRTPRNRVVEGPLPANIIRGSTTAWSLGVKGEIVTTGGDLLFLPHMAVGTATLGAIIQVDILIDDDWWVSNPGGTSNDRALWATQPMRAANHVETIKAPAVALNIPPGRHTWEVFTMSLSAAYVLTWHVIDTWPGTLRMEVLEI